MQTVTYNEQLIAIIVGGDFTKKEGITFFTGDDLTQQLAYMRYPAGHKIIPHLHIPLERRVTATMEVIFVKSGKLAMDLYWDENTLIGTYTLQGGDIVVLASGGHGFRILESSELFEVKQGPYMGLNADKRKFYPEGYEDA